RQTGQDIRQVIPRIDAKTAAVFHDRIEDSGFLACGFTPDEEPVFGSELGRANGVFDEVVVDLDPPVGEPGFEMPPLVEGVGFMAVAFGALD
ncbi:MAG: hypothetical protein QM627_13855, partial [Luteolibacter sp.]